MFSRNHSEMIIDLRWACLCC